MILLILFLYVCLQSVSLKQELVAFSGGGDTTGIPSAMIFKRELDDKIEDASLEEGFSEHDLGTRVLADEDDGDSGMEDGSDIMYTIEEVESAEENDVSDRGATRRRMT